MDDILEKETLIHPIPLILGLLVSSVLFNRVFPNRLLPRRVAHVLGWPLLGGGIVLTGWFQWTLRRNSTSVAYKEQPSNLVTDGPYQYSRNPGYLSAVLIHAGMASLTNRLGTVLLLPVHILLIHYGVIKPEERYLEREFGDNYLNYKAQVRRWI
jgi:protein-S-isoprenylcysteine O-methyltransferase Ste14